jgi:ABC-type microcin C transport system permease subunit YejB
MSFKGQRSILIDNVLLQKQLVITKKKSKGGKLKKVIFSHALRNMKMMRKIRKAF